MRLLLDTHALLWFLDDSPELSSRTKATIEHPDTETLVSIASRISASLIFPSLSRRYFLPNWI